MRYTLPGQCQSCIGDTRDTLRHAQNDMQAACRAAAQYLKLFFLSAFEREDIGSKSSQQAASKPVKAQATLAQWLQQRFDAFTAQLQGLLQSQNSIQLQVSRPNRAVVRWCTA